MSSSGNGEGVHYYYARDGWILIWFTLRRFREDW